MLKVLIIRMSEKRITSQSSSPAKSAGLDSAKNAPPLISGVEAVEKP